MITKTRTVVQLVPNAADLPSEAGFKTGAKGAHSSRTLMLADLETVMAAVGNEAAREDYQAAIVETNCLGKSTAATRRLSAQRLSELYALDPALQLFRAFRNLWRLDSESHPLLALLLALARDPLLAGTAAPVLSLAEDAEFQRDEARAALESVAGDRFNANVLDKVLRNTASSWTQTGHLQGRTFKRRHLVNATAHAATFALYLANMAGFRGAALFSSGWFAVLDCDPGRARELVMEAKRIGLIDLRISAEVVDLKLERLDPLHHKGRVDVAY